MVECNNIYKGYSMKRALIVGGSNGIGLSLLIKLLDKGYDKVYVVDREKPEIQNEKIIFHHINLINEDYSVFDEIQDINTFIYTAGFGRVAPFSNLSEIEINNNFKVNVLGFIHIIKKYYEKLSGSEDFYCAVMGSVAGYVSSPLFSVYSATKSALIKFVESVNIELIKNGSTNRILNISPGSLKGTKFSNGQNDTNLTADLANSIITKIFAHETEYIPDYDSIYKDVLERYRKNKVKFGLESYDYKYQASRINPKPQLKIGYLSGTFDLFHVGHLNLLKRAKLYCDYLVVGVHKDAAHKGKEVFIPFEERVAILESVKYVDKVIASLPEDDAVHDMIGYHFLFVGSDYKGTDRFNRYEEILKPKGVEIIYFPYTASTSSSKIRKDIQEEI